MLPTSLLNSNFKIHINGEWTKASSGESFSSTNPYSGDDWCTIPRCGPQDVDSAVDYAYDAFCTESWRFMPPRQRSELLRNAGIEYLKIADLLAEIETIDTGKRLAETKPQMQMVAQWFDYYAGLADKIEGQTIPLGRSDVFNYTLREPLGVVAAITPWNSPVMIALWKIVPALATGNTVVLKPSELASASSIELIRAFAAAGFPPGVVNIVTGFAQDCGAPLVSHPKVAKVSFTGSDTGGRAVNRSAAKTFKRVTLELGGKSPQIVFADADLDSAVNGVISGIFLSNGQSCVAGSRLYLQSEIRDEFLNRLAKSVHGLKMGDPFDGSTQIGPIANQMQYDKVLAMLEEAQNSGAKCIIGGKPVSDIGAGLFIEPTVLVDVEPQMTIMREEVFGPVLAVSQFDDDEQALKMANDTPYGLASGIWTKDLNRTLKFARQIQSGTVYVNTYRALDVASPVGGYKFSGFGRENGLQVMEEYLQTKSVWIGQSETANPLV